MIPSLALVFPDMVILPPAGFRENLAPRLVFAGAPLHGFDHSISGAPGGTTGKATASGGQLLKSWANISAAAGGNLRYTR